MLLQLHNHNKHRCESKQIATGEATNQVLGRDILGTELCPSMQVSVLGMGSRVEARFPVLFVG